MMFVVNENYEMDSGGVHPDPEALKWLDDYLRINPTATVADAFGAYIQWQEEQKKKRE